MRVTDKLSVFVEIEFAFLSKGLSAHIVSDLTIDTRFFLNRLHFKC